MPPLQGIGYAVQVGAALATAVGIRSSGLLPRAARLTPGRRSLLELAAVLWTLGTILTVAPATDQPAHDNPIPVEWGIPRAFCLTALTFAALPHYCGRSGTDPAERNAPGVVHHPREASHR